MVLCQVDFRFFDLCIPEYKTEKNAKIPRKQDIFRQTLDRDNVICYNKITPNR